MLFIPLQLNYIVDYLIMILKISLINFEFYNSIFCLNLSNLLII